MYPKNQTYIVLPVEKALSLVGDVLNVCRKSVNGKLMIWSYSKDDKKLDSLKNENGVDFLEHDEALKLMSTKEWQHEPDEI